MTLDRLQAFVAALPDRVAAIAEVSAPEIAAKLTADATTRRGNVPQFSPGARGHKGGDIPIAATTDGETITVSAPDWVLAKAIDRGQPDEWIDIIRENVRAEFER